jgi:predicted TIM-barrel fold metal-dependent hydrolase
VSGIDFHVHVTPPDIRANWERYAEKEPYFARLAAGKHNRFAGAEDVVAMLDRSNFDRAVIFGFGFRDMGLCRYVNDFVIAQTRLYPERLCGFMVVPPGSRDAEREIDRCHRAGLCGLGEIFPEGQGCDIADANETAGFAAACAGRGMPVLLHVNEPVGHDYAGKTAGSLRRIEQFIDHHPGLTIVLAHWGGGFLFYETMPEMREKCRRVYYDTAATPFLYDERIYGIARALGITEKIIFGSDFPLLAPARYEAAMEAGGLTAAERERILYGNARRILGITEAPEAAMPETS